MVALRAFGDLDLAEDVAQETLARGLAAAIRGRLTSEDNVGAYLHGIARHVIADLRREQAKVVSTPESTEPSPVPAVALAQLVTNEERLKVRAALARLSIGDQELLRLAFYEGLNSAEIASRLAQPATRIRKRKSRAMGRLRSAFGEARHTPDVRDD